MVILNGYDIESQERVLLEDGGEGTAGLNREFMKDVKQTSAGKRFFADFMSKENEEVSLANYSLVIEAVGKLYPNADCITVSMFVDAADTLMRSGEIQPTREPEAPAVEPAPVPTDRNGRPLTPAQQCWSEYRLFSESHSMQDVRARARVDSGFASFVHKNYEREMNEQGVGDAAVNLNTRPQSSNDRVIPELAAWVEAYRKMPAAEARRRSRADFNPAGYEQWNKMLNLAIAGGLI